MPNKFHSLLTSKTHESLISNLNLSPSEDKALLNASKEIRTAIIAGFTELREQAKRQQLDIEVPSPKFAIQGSYAYGTLNAPANPPAQQVDIDLGVYLPFSVLGNGEKPKAATTYYFNAVTSILNRYIEENRNGQWFLPPEDQQKPSCVRVVLSESSHIDLPLYAVPEDEFKRIMSDSILLAKAKMIHEERHSVSDSEDFSLDEALIEAVEPDVIYMAHREEGWKPSDALVIRAWVMSGFNNLGSMIRPVNRFLKSWRDEEWPEGGGPSSIFLLAHSLKFYPQDSNGMTHCEVLEHVICELTDIFSRPLLVPCPTSEDREAKENLHDRITPEKKEIYKTAFSRLSDQYVSARKLQPEAANQVLINLFGNRMPNDPARIEVTSELAAHINHIQSAEPDIKPLYTTDRSTSG